MASKPSPGGMKRSLDSFNNFLWGIKNFSQSNERPLKSALYNILMIAAVGVVVAVSFVLGPFLKPLLWAFLFGAVLYPFKRSISSMLNGWFEQLETDNQSIVIAVVVVPFKFLDSLGEFCGTWLKENIKFIGGIVAGAITIRVLISFKSYGIFCMMWKMVYWAHGLFSNCLNMLSWPILTTIVGLYLAAVIFFWQPAHNFKFTIAGQFLWTIIVAYCCSFLGALQVPVFLFIMMYSVIGIGYDIKTRVNLEHNDSFTKNLMSLINVKAFYKKLHAVPEKTHTTTTTPTVHETMAAVSRSKDQLNVEEVRDVVHDNSINNLDAVDDGNIESDVFFKILFYACAATIFYQNTWLLFILMIPLLFYGFNKFCVSFGVRKFVVDKITNFWNFVWNWVVERHAALLPICLPGVIQINDKIHLATRNYLKSSVDLVSSILMIIILIFTVTFAGIFFCVQIYSETFAVVQLGSDLVNRTLTARPDLIQMLPEGFQGSMDNVIDNAHHYGRQSIETYVDDLFRETEPEQAKKLKVQILLVWDRLIQSWMDRSDSIGPKTTTSAISDTIDEIVDNPELMTAAKQGITDWAKSNLGMIMEVMDSLWIIIRKNMYLLGSILGTIFSMVLGGGHAFITFIVNTIIFFTALFYLLSSSGERYAGLAAIDALGSSMGTKIAESLEDSISCVIIATLKLALFHGTFTWLTHTWFGAHVVFLPAAIAALFAAAPFLGTYWCSVPAFLDLWLSQDRFYMGCLLFLIHFVIPSSFVDPTIIAEIKGGGHPYLTGLSIAGGMFWLGAEGAILGPLFLCFLVVIFDLTTTSLKESPSHSNIRTPMSGDKDKFISELRLTQIKS